MIRPNLKYLAPIVGVAGIVAAYFIAPYEGEKFHAYQDGIGVWTVCKGHTKGVTQNTVATREQCDVWYAEDVAIAVAAYDRLVSTPQHPNTKASAVSFIFNAGEGNFKKSTFRRKLNAGDRVGACNELLRWIYAGGRDCRVKENKCYGLIARRQAEKELCLANDINVCPGVSADDFGACLQASQLAGEQPAP